MKNLKIVIEGGQIQYIFADPSLADLEIEIVDYDEKPKSTAEKERDFTRFNESLISIFQ